MSLNTSHADGGVLIYNGERILIYSDDTELSLSSDTPVQHFKGNKKGSVYLTTHRVIFLNQDHKDMLHSFSMPFMCLRQLELEQPIFGANYIKGKVCAEQGGNWQGVAKFKLWFNSGGAIEFGQTMLRAGQLASQHRVPQAPSYVAPPSGPYYQAPPPAYTPQAQYDFVPYATFPTAPPQDGVYMTGAPPPYPGIDPQTVPTGYPPQGPSCGAEAKAQEAAMSSAGYYNPSQPHNVYAAASAPQHDSLPPAYSDIAKKND